MTRLAASVVLTDAHGRILLVHEDYGKRRWRLPGGCHEPGETIEETAVREAKEETNLDVELGELIGEYLIVSAVGEELLDVSVFVATILGGELLPPDAEIDDIGWFDPGTLPHPMTNTAPPAISDAVRGARGVHRRVVSAHCPADTMPLMDQQRVLHDVVAWATDDPNVRLVVVTGSFAGGDHDNLSDLDVELYVRETHALLEESAWYERFGSVLVTEALENPGWHATRLVYYADGKIDFMIAPVLALAEGVSYDGPYLVMVDKDARTNRLEPIIGVAPPSADDFRICVNWFYAAALQYAKAVARDDPWPIKTRDADLKERLLQMIEWDYGVRTGWAERPPHNGARLAEWADPDVVDAVAACWADFSTERSAVALRNSIELFDHLTASVAASLGYPNDVAADAAAEVERMLAGGR